MFAWRNSDEIALPIDIGFTGALELNYGVDIELDATPVEMDEGEDCYIFSGSFAGEVEPRIEMRAHLSGAAGESDTVRFKIKGGNNPIYVATNPEAVGANVSVDATLPVELDIDITAVEDLSNVTLDLEANAGLSVESGMQGQLYFWLEREDGDRLGWPFAKDYSIPLTFDGPGFEMTLFDEEHEFDVDTWTEICDLYGCTES